jgi:RimJ/RimL family protein N-acetyltransferase
MQTFLIPPVLENKIALIKPLEEAHFEALTAIASEPALWEMSPRKVETKEHILSYLREAMTEKEKHISIPFVIIDKRSNEVAGSTRYSKLFPAHKRLEIGWTWIGTKFQSTGLNRAVKFELLQYGFETLGLNRIELKTDALNMQSRTAMKKIGATEEGIFRKHMLTASGRIRDTVYLSILKEEWPGIKTTVFHAFY